MSDESRRMKVSREEKREIDIIKTLIPLYLV